MAFADVRRSRLKSDYEQISNMTGSVLTFRPLSGVAPYIDKYEITLHIKTIISPAPEYRDKHIIHLSFGPTYPFDRPITKMVSRPQPYHCNWWDDGLYCSNVNWSPAEKLGDYLVRLIRTLQFDMEITNPNSPANKQAMEWYLSKRESGLFPCDRTKLPDPIKR